MKKTAKKKTVRKKPAAQKKTRKASRKTPKLRPYVPPKTAAELGILRAVMIDGERWDKSVAWFDYALGERSHLRGFVFDELMVSRRMNRLPS